MKKINIIQLIASICLLIGSIINLLNLVIEIPFGLYVCTGPLLLISVVLLAVVIVKQIKKKNGKKQSYIIPQSSNPVSTPPKISFLQPLHKTKTTQSGGFSFWLPPAAGGFEPHRLRYEGSTSVPKAVRNVGRITCNLSENN